MFARRQDLNDWAEICAMSDWEYKTAFIKMLNDFQASCGDCETHNLIQRFRIEHGLDYRPANYESKELLIEAGVPEHEIIQVIT